MNYACADCGKTQVTWVSVCTSCGSGAVFSIGNRVQSVAETQARLKKFSEIPAKNYPRQSTGFTNLDKILGGGLVDGSVILVTGEPGAGKSTLMLQVLGALVNAGQTGAMIHAEESAEQLAARAMYWELPSRSFFMIPDRQLEKAFQVLKPVQRLNILLADSLQTITTLQSASPDGSPNQVRACCHLLTEFAKRKRCTVIIIGHVTKEGEMSGPQTLKHLVDVTLHLEFSQTHDTRREITSIKNRFGPSPYTLPLTLTSFGFRNEK